MLGPGARSSPLTRPDRDRATRGLKYRGHGRRTIVDLDGLDPGRWDLAQDVIQRHRVADECPIEVGGDDLSFQRNTIGQRPTARCLYPDRSSWIGVHVNERHPMEQTNDVRGINGIDLLACEECPCAAGTSPVDALETGRHAHRASLYDHL